MCVCVCVRVCVCVCVCVCVACPGACAGKLCIDQPVFSFKGAGTPISSQMHTFFHRKLTGVFLSTLHYGSITSKAIFIPTLCFIGYTCTTIFL